MARTHRNPYKNIVTRSVLRASEKVVTIIEEGQAPRIIGEFITFEANSATSNIDVPIGGQSGDVTQKIGPASNTWTATYYIGSDGSWWEKLWQDVRNGIDRPFIMITSTKDDGSHLVGERIKRYSETRLTNATGLDTMAADNTPSVGTLSGTFEEDEIIQGFTPIQV